MEEKKKVMVYISEEAKNVLKSYYVEKTGQSPNLSGALTFLADEIKKSKKTH